MTYVKIPTNNAKLMEHRIASLVCSLSKPMDELWYLLRKQGIKVKDKGVVPAKDSLMLKLDNPFFLAKESLVYAA